MVRSGFCERTVPRSGRSTALDAATNTELARPSSLQKREFMIAVVVVGPGWGSVLV